VKRPVLLSLVLALCAGCSLFQPSARTSSTQVDPAPGYCTAGWFKDGIPWDATTVVWGCTDDYGSTTYESPGMSGSVAKDVFGDLGTIVTPVVPAY